MIKNKSRMKNNRMTKILHELIKKSSRSDHEIAKVIEVSQPTVTRLRNQLEKEGIIREYTIIPDLTKMGIQLWPFFASNIKRIKKKK